MDLEEYLRSDCVGILNDIHAGKLEPSKVRNFAIQALEEIDAWKACVEIYDRGVETSDKGILRGLPILHKDSCSIRGLPLTYGTNFIKDNISSETNEFFKRLLSEGVSVVGRSSVPEFTLSVVGDNASLGSPMNPYHSKHSVGGSTAGVGALALGAVPVIHGMDAGGSLRIPAAWSGCYTIKPTKSRVSGLPVGNPIFGMDQHFVITRSIRDLRLFSSILLSPWDGQFYDVGESLQDFSKSGRRIGVLKSVFRDVGPSEPRISDLKNVSSKCVSMGYDIEEIDLDLDFEEYCEALFIIFSADLAGFISNISSKYPNWKQHSQEFLVGWSEECRKVTAAELINAIEYLEQVSIRVTRLLDQNEFLISPVTAREAPLLDTTHKIGVNPREMNAKFEEIIQFCAIFNMSGHPALCLPSGLFQDGLPGSIQIVGRPGSERSLLDFADLIDVGFTPPDSVQH